MAITKLTTDVEIITALSDSPSLTNNELKAKFDEAGNLIQTYYNEVLTSEVDALLSGLDTSKRNTADVYKLLYDYSTLGSITDGSTKTIPGFSNYSLFIADDSYGSHLLQMNHDKTKIFGINKWYAFDDDNYWMMMKTIFGTVSGDTVVFTLKSSTHKSEQTHGVLNSSSIKSIYGLI